MLGSTREKQTVTQVDCLRPKGTSLRIAKPTAVIRILAIRVEHTVTAIQLQVQNPIIRMRPLGAVPLTDRLLVQTKESVRRACLVQAAA